MANEQAIQSGVSATPLTLVVNRKSRHGSETRKRQKFARFRVTDDELAQLSIAADRANLDISSFLRVQCLGTPVPRKARAPSVDRELLGYVAAQLGKIGSNLNQIARVLNSGGDEPDDITLAIEDVRQAMADIKRAAGKKPS